MSGARIPEAAIVAGCEAMRSDGESPDAALARWYGTVLPILEAAASAIEAATLERAGRAVVDLPAPDEDLHGDPVWNDGNGYYVVATNDHGPVVDLPDGSRATPEYAEEFAAILLAAARAARAKSAAVSGDQKAAHR